MDIATELHRLAGTAASGHVDVQSGEVRAQVWLHEGRVASVTVSSARPALGMRLVSSGKVSLAHLGQALSHQKENPHMRLGDVLVRMGLVTRQDVETLAWEQMCDNLAGVLGLPDPAITFTAVAPTAAPPASATVSDVLSAATARMDRLDHVVREVGGPDTVPALSDDLMDSADRTLRPEEWGLLCRVDGHRTLRSISEQAGFSVLEGASILQALIAAGLVTVPVAAPTSRSDTPQHAPTAPAPPPPPPASPFDDPSDLLRELSDLAGGESGRRRRPPR